MANEYKVKVGVEFNAIMTKVDSALTALQEKLKKLGSLTGAKDVTSGLSEGLQKIVNGFNELKNFTITPKNLNEYMGKLQALEEELKAVGLSSKDINQSLFSDKKNSAAENIQKTNDEIKKLESNIEALNKKKTENSATNPFTEKDAQDLKNYEQELEKAQKSLIGYTSYQTRLKNASESLGLTEEQLTEILKLLAQAHKEAADAGKKQKEGQQQLEDNKLADTIKTQVDRFIGLNAIYRYTKKYIQDLVKTYKEFDESLVAIAAVTGQTRDQMWANISVYNKMAQSLGTTTQEVINASKLYYQQGLTTTSVLKLTEETVKLATIAELDSADATEYLTTAMNGFKLSAEESTRVTDVWANLAAKTASDVDELAVAISKVASLAENAGMEIETASAFLNQMIETTREAPENLGTALKTIIARFQELKVSEEALSDGVDANKVEKALRSANVELRDATGQFRDFDEVILDLSAKWNTLDRNTQRYIATIAAGSRQQSRFIAMVSDYEGLLRNVNYAYDSLGSADAQMAVFQEGLAASTNRLQAAWEGLYTSWSESATVISKLIDGMANFISILADLGAGTSGLITIIGLLTATILANAAAYAINHKAQLGGLPPMKALHEAFTTLIIDKIKDTALTLAAVAPYVALAAAIGLVTYAIIRRVTFQSQYIKNLEQEIQKTEQLAAQEKDRASSAGVLIDELDNAKNSEEELEKVRQKVIDQFGDQIEGIDDLTLSYDELIQKLKEYKKEQEKAAILDYIDADKKQRQDDILNSDWFQQTIGDTKTKRFRIEEKAMPGQYEIDQETGKLKAKIKTVFVLDLADIPGEPSEKEFDNPEDLVEEANRIADITDRIDKYETKDSTTLSSQKIKLAASVIIDNSNIEEPFKDLENATAVLAKKWADEGILEAIIKGEGDYDPQEDIENLNNGLKAINSTLTDVEKTEFSDFLNGQFAKFDRSKIEDFINSLTTQLGASNPYVQEINTLFEEYRKTLSTKWAQFGHDLGPVLKNIGQSWAYNVQEGFLERYEEESNEVAKKAIWSINQIQEATGQTLASLDGDALWASFIENYDKLDESAKNAYLSLIKIDEVSFDHAKDTFSSLANDMATFKKAASDGLSADEFFVKAHDWAIQLQELSDAQLKEIGITREQALAWVLSNKELDVASGTYKLSTDAVKVLAEARVAEAKSTLQDSLAVAKASEAQAQNALTAYDVANSLDNLALANAKTAAITAFGADAWQIYWDYANGTISEEQASAKLGALGTSIEEVTASIQGFFEGGPSDEKRAALEQDLQAAKDLVAAYETDLSELEDFSVDAFLAGKGGASGADKESKKYLDTLKQLAEQLKETAEEAEAAAKREIAAILAVLEAEKAKLEEMQKEREEWRDKESEELELWIKAQIALLQEEQKAQEKAYQDNEDALSLQAEAAQTYYNQQIEAIQAKIDALDAESEAEDRLLKLQQARDAYNKAQNSKSRLVLTKGAGWIFKADQKEVADARKQLQDVQREIQKAVYQDQIDELQKQADEWEKIADGIGKSAEEIAKLAAAVEEFGKNAAAGTGYADIEAFTKAVEALQSQKATMDFNADETAEGSLAYQIAQLEEALEKVGRSFEDQLLAERLEAITEVLRGQNEEQGYADTTGQILGHVETYMQEFSKVAHEYSETAAKIAEIEKSIELWKSIDENLGLTVEEIEEAKKLYDKYSKKFEKFGTKAFDEQSKAYKAMLDKIGEIAKYFSEAKEAEERAKTYEEATKNGFSSGGVVDFYGPADLHGTIAEPEVVFNARQASALFNWVKSLSSFGIPQINGVNPTPVVTTSNNSMRTNTISIGELYINSSANNFDGLVADITRNSMLRQPI